MIPGKRHLLVENSSIHMHVNVILEDLAEGSTGFEDIMLIRYIYKLFYNQHSRRENCTHKVFVVVFQSVEKFRQNIKSCLNISKMAASQWVSTIPKSFVSFQTLRLKIHERQSRCNTIFFPISN